jgi:hypothetical protein
MVLNKVAEEEELSECENYLAGKCKRNEDNLKKGGLQSAAKSLKVKREGKKKGGAIKATE